VEPERRYDNYVPLITAGNTTYVQNSLCCNNEQFETALLSGPPISSGSGGHMLTPQSYQTLLADQVSDLILIWMSSEQYLIIITAPGAL
jgi:hypothetical protein